jgi:hypothetical protein
MRLEAAGRGMDIVDGGWRLLIGHKEVDAVGSD